MLGQFRAVEIQARRNGGACHARIVAVLDFLSKNGKDAWEAFMTAPLPLLVALVAVAGFIWWFRGFLIKTDVSTLERQLSLAKDQHEAESKEVARLKDQVQELRKAIPPADPRNRLATDIVVTVTSLAESNNALSTTLGISSGAFRAALPPRSDE
jgi:hypothetical protein